MDVVYRAVCIAMHRCIVPALVMSIHLGQLGKIIDPPLKTILQLIVIILSFPANKF